MTENRASEAVHFCVTALAGPAAEEKLSKTAWHAEFWLTHIASRAIHSIPVNRNGRFRSVRHRLYLGCGQVMVKAQIDAKVNRSC